MIKKIGSFIFWVVSIFWLNIVFPTFLLSLISAFYMAVKTKTYSNFFKTTETFSYHVKDGTPTTAYSYYASFAAAIVVLVHSLFAYFYYDYKFYPVRDVGSIWVDCFCSMLWISGTSTLVVIVGRNFGEMLRTKSIDFIFKKRILSYLKFTLMIIPINIGLWYLLTLWKPELDNNLNAFPHLYLRFHHLWFFIYTILYYLITFLIVKYLNWRILKSIFSPVKFLVQKFPDSTMLLISFVFLIKSNIGIIVGNPESSYKIEPFVFGYFFFVFIFGLLTAYTKNYIISNKKLFIYMSLAIFFMWFLYQLVLVQNIDEKAKMILLVITSSILIVCQQNLSLSMCCQFFSKANPGINFIKNATGPLFCFNLPLIVLLHFLLKGIDIPIILKVLIINYSVWLFFIGLSFLLKKRSKKLIKKS
jgi:hypothetical protein